MRPRGTAVVIFVVWLASVCCGTHCFLKEREAKQQAKKFERALAAVIRVSEPRDSNPEMGALTHAIETLERCDVAAWPSDNPNRLLERDREHGLDAFRRQAELYREQEEVAIKSFAPARAEIEKILESRQRVPLPGYEDLITVVGPELTVWLSRGELAEKVTPHNEHLRCRFDGLPVVIENHAVIYTPQEFAAKVATAPSSYYFRCTDLANDVWEVDADGFPYIFCKGDPKAVEVTAARLKSVAIFWEGLEYTRWVTDHKESSEWKIRFRPWRHECLGIDDEALEQFADMYLEEWRADTRETRRDGLSWGVTAEEVAITMLNIRLLAEQAEQEAVGTKK